MYQIQFRTGLRRDPAGFVYSATQAPSLLLRDGDGKGREMENEGRERRKEGEGGRRKERRK